MMSASYKRLQKLTHFAFYLSLSALALGCGGSSSETPMPLEPIAHPAEPDAPQDEAGTNSQVTVDKDAQSTDPPAPASAEAE